MGRPKAKPATPTHKLPNYAVLARIGDGTWYAWALVGTPKEAETERAWAEKHGAYQEVVVVTIGTP